LTGHGGENVLSVAVKKQLSGIGPHLSAHVHHLAVGDEVFLEVPGGIFTPPLQGNRPLIFLAAGIGITPFMGHLEALLALAPAERVNDVLLLYTCRNGSEHPFATRLRELETQLPQLKLVTAFTAPRSTDRLHRDYDHAGRPDFSALDPLMSKRPLVYLCGSPDFTSSMTARLVERGLPRFDIFAEAFASPPEVPTTLEPQTIHLAGSDKSFVWSPELGTLLDAAHAAGVPLPSGCRVGQCESCAMRIVDGRVAQLGSGDSSAEHCLTCQTVPLSELTLAL
jgi:ferredoxin-NADP reductase